MLFIGEGESDPTPESADGETTTTDEAISFAPTMPSFKSMKLPSRLPPALNFGKLTPDGAYARANQSFMVSKITN